jgi:ATP-dependent phosphoenolpyruvate carboxykinase
MKTLNFLIIVMIFFSLSCTQKTVLSTKDKKAVETEIVQFMETLDHVFESVVPEEVFKLFLQTDEFAVASQGNLITNPGAILDTMKVHMAFMKNQNIKSVADKIFVINKDAVVISTSKMTTITFKNDNQITMPYALTMLLVKRDGKWKIAHYHN